MESWEAFLKKQDEELGKETSSKWLRSLKVVHFDACNLYLEAKDSFQALWFEEHVRPKIKGKLTNNNHHPIKVHLTVAEESTVSRAPNKQKEKKASAPAPSLFVSDALDPSCTLTHFITASANQIPLQFLKEFESNHSSPFNPIYLYGGPGVGKTHLLMALARLFQEKGLSILFVHAETFTEHVVTAIRSGMMREFRKTYRNIDALFIDDVHLFARRGATQEELFHTFNTLHTARKQILLSGNVPPSALIDIEPRLSSRFEWGIPLRLEKLLVEDLKLLLEQRIAQLDFSLESSVQNLLIEKFRSGPKALIRALEALVLRAHVEHRHSQQITSEIALYYLKELLEEESRCALTPLKIIRIVADVYGIPTDDILGKSHSHECAFPRQVAMFLCRSELKLAFQKIGSLFDRDHSTVMTSVKAIQKKIDSNDKELASSLNEIVAKLDQPS